MLDGVEALNKQVGEKELTIDLGAHPNETGFFGRLSMKDGDTSTNKRVLLKYLAGGDIAHIAALKYACQVGVAVLDCYIQMFRTRFDILQMTAKIDALKRGL